MRIYSGIAIACCMKIGYVCAMIEMSPLPINFYRIPITEPEKKILGYDPSIGILFENNKDVRIDDNNQEITIFLDTQPKSKERVQYHKQTTRCLSSIIAVAQYSDAPYYEEAFFEPDRLDIPSSHLFTLLILKKISQLRDIEKVNVHFTSSTVEPGINVLNMLMNNKNKYEYILQAFHIGEKFKNIMLAKLRKGILYIPCIWHNKVETAQEKKQKPFIMWIKDKCQEMLQKKQEASALEYTSIVSLIEKISEWQGHVLFCCTGYTDFNQHNQQIRSMLCQAEKNGKKRSVIHISKNYDMLPNFIVQENINF